MSDKGSVPAPRSRAVVPREAGEVALTLTALEDCAIAHAAACSILEQIDLMMALADLTTIAPAWLTLLQRARAEAARVMADAAQALRPH